MRTIEQHRREITGLLTEVGARLGSETLSVDAAGIAAHPELYANRVLAADLAAPTSLPGFDNSQMDGYAVLAADLAGAASDAPVSLSVADRIAAGDPFGSHTPRTATPIMTGAALPSGADAVVQIEKADPPVFPPDDVVAAAGGDPGTVRPRPVVSFAEPVAAGTFVRRAGSDVAAGEVLLTAGTILGAAQYGVLSGAGATEVTVRRRLRVLLVSTGHEIREPGSTLEPGQIFDANSTALTVALLSIGCAVTPRPCRSDDASDLLALLSGEAEEHDVVVTVGGVSAGAREVVRDALGPLGVDFMKVAMQPGGPQGFGLAELAVDAAGAAVSRPVICLPGNPVSALVSFEAFLRPALLAASGASKTLRENRRGRAAVGFDSPPGHHQLRRGRVDDDGVLELVGGASSHLLHSYAQSSVLVQVGVGTASVAPGDELDYWRIDG
ncbi:gephyrin-like molybdotransferase Glp [Herbiconiux sp. P18]|uniref:molybdopterin molybdotransferase MoeA n=1 Tax=Herbiconiux liangxiaofengii TaxID=3342795 RepID=UPI0035B7B30C